MPFRYCWEDFTPGRVFERGARTLCEEDIVRFAREWDPQRYHTDPQAAKLTPFGGLIASGWQSCAVLMRLMCDGYLNESSCVGSPGIDEIRFLKPVRPGDGLRFRATVLESSPSICTRISSMLWRKPCFKGLAWSVTEPTTVGASSASSSRRWAISCSMFLIGWESRL